MSAFELGVATLLHVSTEVVVPTVVIALVTGEPPLFSTTDSPGMKKSKLLLSVKVKSNAVGIVPPEYP
jgi:hypothetical protein